MNILVVDDSKSFRKLISALLKKNGFETIEAGNCDEAMTAIKRVDVDLVVLDIQMPDVDGFEVCEQIRTNGGDQSNVPVIFVTGTQKVEYRKRGFTLGATDFILKDNITFELLETVNNILRPSMIFKDIKILAVDDSSMIRKLITQILENKGVNVTSVVDGLEAYEYLEKNIDELDLIITDEEMPKINGGELCQKVRKNLGNKEIPIIMISGKTDEISVGEIFKAGATDYLHKPFIEDEFLARIKNLLQSSILRKRFSSIIKNKQSTETNNSIDIDNLRKSVNELIGYVNKGEENPELKNIIINLKSIVEN